MILIDSVIEKVRLTVNNDESYAISATGIAAAATGVSRLGINITSLSYGSQFRMCCKSSCSMSLGVISFTAMNCSRFLIACIKVT